MDEAAFITLCKTHLAAFYRMAVSILHHQPDAEDAVQQALLSAWRVRHRARAGLERAWVMRMVINESISILRKRRRAIPTEDFPCAAAPDDTETAELHAAIQALPEGLRIPVLLKYVECMSEKEVAAAMKLPLSAVKNRLFRARRHLQKQLREEVSP